MPGLTIALNGTQLATVSTEGSNILTVCVHGDMVGPEFASLDVAGGHYGEGSGAQSHLTWVHEQSVRPGDEIEIGFLESATSSHSGKTIDELFPEEEPMGPWQPLDEVFRELASMPKVRERFTFVVTSPEGDEASSETGPSDHSFGFSVLWDWTRPERARVSLSSTTLENIESRAGGTRLADMSLCFGQRVKLRVDV